MTNHMAARSLPKWRDAEQVCRKLNDLHRREVPLWDRALRKHSPKLHAAIVRCFPSYRAAIEAAGMDYKKIRRHQHWDRCDVLDALDQRRRQGKPLNCKAVEHDNGGLCHAAKEIFGAYRKAIEALGLNYDSVLLVPRDVWSRQRVIERFHVLKQQGADLWMAATRRREPYLVLMGRKYFGSYAKAALAAGIDATAIKAPPRPVRLTAAQVVETLQRLGRQGVSNLRPSALEARDARLVPACKARFGSYRRAVTAAGFDYEKIVPVGRPPMRRQEVLRSLREIDSCGGDLRLSAVKRTHGRVLYSARRRFGTYRKAVQAAGLGYPPKKPLHHWPWPLVLQRLRELHQQGENLERAAFARNHVPLYAAAIYYYRSYVGAVGEAGLNYRDILKHARQLELRSIQRTEAAA
jgi:hypothetical protein